MDTQLASLSAVAATAPLDKNLLITNNSSVDLMMIDAVAADDNQILYQQQLTPYTTTDNLAYLKSGQSGSVVLDDYHVNDSGESVYSKLYDVLYVRTENLYPVKSKSSSLNHSTQNYTSVTINDQDVALIKKAENFTQTISAYPSSSLAHDFYTAVDKSNNAADGDTTDYVSNFFADTPDFKDLDIFSFNIISSYYSAFPYVWAGYKSSKTYYLYSGDNNVISYIGSLTIKVPIVIPAEADKKLSAFSFTFTDASNVTKLLYYQDGQFVDNQTAGVPGICLAGTFVLKSDLTKVDTDNIVIPVICGKVFDANVIGLDEKQQIGEGTDKWSGTYSVLHPRDVGGWIALLLAGICVITGLKIVTNGIEFLQKKTSKAKAEQTDDDSLNKDQVDELKIEKSKYTSDLKAEYQELLNKLDSQLELTTDVNAGMNDFGEKFTDRLNGDMKSSLQDNLQEQSDLIESILDYGNPESLQTVGDLVLSNSNLLDAAKTPAEIVNTLDNVKKNVTDVKGKLSAELTHVNEMVSAEQKKVFDEATELIEEHEKTSENIDRSTEYATDNKVPDNIEFGSIGF